MLLLTCVPLDPSRTRVSAPGSPFAQSRRWQLSCAAAGQTKLSTAGAYAEALYFAVCSLLHTPMNHEPFTLFNSLELLGCPYSSCRTRTRALLLMPGCFFPRVARNAPPA